MTVPFDAERMWRDKAGYARWRKGAQPVDRKPNTFVTGCPIERPAPTPDPGPPPEPGPERPKLLPGSPDRNPGPSGPAAADPPAGPEVPDDTAEPDWAVVLSDAELEPSSASDDAADDAPPAPDGVHRADCPTARYQPKWCPGGDGHWIYPVSDKTANALAGLAVGGAIKRAGKKVGLEAEAIDGAVSDLDMSELSDDLRTLLQLYGGPVCRADPFIAFGANLYQTIEKSLYAAAYRQRDINRRRDERKGDAPGQTDAEAAE